MCRELPNLVSSRELGYEEDSFGGAFQCLLNFSCIRTSGRPVAFKEYTSNHIATDPGIT